MLRDLVNVDLAVGDDLLKRKYDWIKLYIFEGAEFGLQGQPLLP